MERTRERKTFASISIIHIYSENIERHVEKGFIEVGYAISGVVYRGRFLSLRHSFSLPLVSSSDARDG